MSKRCLCNLCYQIFTYNACSVHYTNKIYLTLIVLPFIQAKPILTDFFARVEYTSRYYTFFGKVCLRFFCFYLGGGCCFCEEGIKGSWTPPLQSFCLLQCAMSLCFFSKNIKLLKKLNRSKLERPVSLYFREITGGGED